MTQFNYSAAVRGEPIETLRGIQARILQLDFSLAKPLIVQVGDQVYNYTVEGKRSRKANSTPLDLRMVNTIKEIEDVRYLNVSYYEENDIADKYKVGVYIHKTRKEAFESAKDAKNVRIVAMPVPFSFRTDEIALFSKGGEALVVPESVARKIMQRRSELIKE